MSRHGKWLFVLGATACLLGPALVAEAAMYGFTRITSNSPEDVASQFFVDVTDVGMGKYNFLFTNTGPIASSITDVYFSYPALSGTASLDSIDDSDPGVAFSALATPGELPGGNAVSPSFQTSLGLSADSDPPAQPNGVNPGESLGIVLDLQHTRTFDALLEDINSGALRLGLHVQGIGSDGDSDSFVNGELVPAPGAVVLGTIGLLAVGLVKRKLT